MLFRIVIVITLLLCSVISKEIDLKNTKLYNPTAYISSQCYTKTIDKENENILNNPCFSCHTKNKEPNYTLSDSDLQEAYDFPETALKNPWLNLFKDRTKLIRKISDESIINYIKQNNYKTLDNKIILEKKLKNIQKNWDFNNNKKWDGYIPDCYFNFDNEGFDKDLENKYTLWRAFAYRPFLGTFWPTNGSTDDVLIRLPKYFSLNDKEQFDLETYKINLFIIEALIKQKNINTFLIDEKKYKVDLNQDGKLNFTNKIVFKWEKPDFDLKTFKLSNFSMSYVGKAKNYLNKNIIHIAPGLYPIGTEFLHTVRYINTQDNKISLAPRLKELRYARKSTWYSYSDLKALGDEEIKEKHDFPDRVDKYVGNIETGLNNKRGWQYQGFIEDTKGELRPQSYEETLFCMGCHSNIGAIADSTFVFQRKLENKKNNFGWYHWLNKDLKNISDMKLHNNQGEFERYLKLNNAGDEFHTNDEVLKKFFIKNWKKDTKNIEKDLITKLENPNKVLNQEWKLKTDALAKLKNDISYLILPSKKRALELNKAYKIIVDEQSFIYGREAHFKPTQNVHKKVKQGQSTNLQKVIR